MRPYWKKILVITFLGANLLIGYYNFVYLKRDNAMLHPARTISAERARPTPLKSVEPAGADPRKTPPLPVPPAPQPGEPAIIIGFNPGKPALTPQAKEGLLNIFNKMSANQSLDVKIDGHADNSGKPEKNIVLSVERAKFVKDYLVQLGVADKRVIIQGYGSTKPIADNATKEGQAQNRRVEITLIPN